MRREYGTFTNGIERADEVIVGRFFFFFFFFFEVYPRDGKKRKRRQRRKTRVAMRCLCEDDECDDHRHALCRE